MKKTALLTVLVLLLAGAAPVFADGVYGWYNYQSTSYNYLKKQDEAAEASLIKTYEKIISRPRGSSKTVPPGIYADYGWLLIKRKETEKGIEMLRKEMELYPESAVFITRILKRFDK